MVTTLVTFFYDIKRESWSDKTSKSFDKDYLEPFKILLNYNYDLIVYIDDKYYDILLSEVEESNNTKTKLYPINEEWMKKNIWAWNRLDREKEIMNSDSYKNKIPKRISMGYPENTRPEYTILTHSKIDFINYAIEEDNNNSDYYMWVDFGYFQNKTSSKFLPSKGVIDIDKLNTETVNICSVNKIDDKDKDINYTLVNAPEKIGAYLFFGTKDNLKEFQLLCHKHLEHFQEIGIADDEQHLWLQCYFEKPELFTEHVLHGWHLALKRFSK